MGSVHFWCNFLGIKKVYKVENQLLVDCSERRGRIGYYAPDGRSALRLSLLLAAGAPASQLRKKQQAAHLLFFTPLSASKLAPKV